MPTYEYVCRECDVAYEEDRSFDEPQRLVECIECGGLLKRIFSGPLVTFNGTGFYATDKKGE